MKKLFLTVVLLLLTALLALPATSYSTIDKQAQAGKKERRAAARFVPGQVLVKFKPGVKGSKKEAAKSEAGAVKLVRKIGPKGHKRLYVYNLASGRSVLSAVAELRRNQYVEAAEPNYIYRSTLTPNDTLFGEQWGLHNTGQTIDGQAGTADSDIDGPEAWDIVGSVAKKATVAVIDTGIDAGHPDLSAKLWVNSSETPNNNIDDDGNGFVDDVNGHNWAYVGQVDFNEGTVYFGSDSPDPYIPDMAQSFIGNGGKIQGVWLEAVRYGSPAGPVRVALRSSLGGADLTFVDLPAGSFSTNWSSAWIYAAFPTPVKVNDGATYFLTLNTGVQNYDHSYGVSITESAGNGGMNVFPNGSLWTKQSGIWTEAPNDDVTFDLEFEGLAGRGGRPKDDNGHGTHVSGIVAGQVNNAAGVGGIAGWPAGAAQVMPLRVLGTDGYGDTANIVDAVYYAADNGADVINMSLGGGSFSTAFQDAINYADGKNIVVLAAAGNTGGTAIQYPAGYTNVIGVGATDNRDQKASFSTYNSSVDISAPGVDILSTLPTYANNSTAVWGYSLNSDYFSGTSMATPMAAGLAALVKAVNPAQTPAEVFGLLQNNALDLGAVGRDDSFGYGRINAFDTITDVPRDVTAPTGTLKINAGAARTKSSAATLNFTADDGGGTGVTQMRFAGTPAGVAAAAYQPYAASAPFTLTGSDGTKWAYAQFKDAAGNESTVVGDSIFLDRAAPAASLTAPLFSTQVSKTANFSVSWSGSDPAPSSGGLKYDVQRKVNAGSWAYWKTSTTAKTGVFTGSAGSTYYFRARVKDAAGNISAWSATKKTIVPYNEGSLIIARSGFGGYYSSASSNYYKGTVRYSTAPGNSITYRFTGNRVSLIATKGPNRAKAKIYVDGVYKATVDAYKSSTAYRQAIYTKTWAATGVHTIKLVSVGSSWRTRFDVDGLAIGR